MGLRKQQWNFHESKRVNRVAILPAFLLIILSFMVNGCGLGNIGGGVAVLDDAELGLKAVATSGSDQIVAPGTRYEEVIFSVTDVEGKPFEGAKVYFKLVDLGEDAIVDKNLITGETDNIRKDYKCNSRSQDKALGQIIECSAASDKMGLARVLIDSSSAFEKNIVVAMRIFGGDGIPGVVAHAVLSTKAFGGNSRIYSFSANTQLPMKSGTIFFPTVSIQVEGETAVGLPTIERILRLTWFIPISGSESIYQEGEVGCVFIKGVCNLQTTTLNTKGIVNVTIEDVAKEIQGTSASLEVEGGDAGGLLIFNEDPLKNPLANADTCPLDLSKVCLEMDADLAAIDYWVGVVDGGGNFIASSSSTWSVLSGPLSDQIATGFVEAQQTLAVSKSGKGSLKITNGDFDLTVTYEVKPGFPVSYRLYSEHSGTEVATVPFKVFVAALDQYGNWCRYLDETQAITFSLTGAGASPNGIASLVSLTEDVNFTPSNQPYPASGQPEFIISSLSEGFLQAVNIGDQPKIVAQGTSNVAGGTVVFGESEPLIIMPGEPATLVLRDAPSGGGSQYAAPMTIPIASSRVFYPAGYDSLGNFSTDLLANFLGTGVIAVGGVVSPPTGSLSVVAPTVTGTGTLQVEPLIAGIASVETDTITVTSSAAVRMEMLTTNNCSVNTSSGTCAAAWGCSWNLTQCDESSGNHQMGGQRFHIRVQALDNAGFVATTYTGIKPLEFTFSGNASWAGDLPSLPAGSIDCLFVEGVCDLASDYWIADITSVSFGTVTDSSGEISETAAVIITGEVGTANRKIKLANGLGGPGASRQILDNLVAADLIITADDTMDIGAAIVDEGGNYVSDAPALGTDFSTSGFQASELGSAANVNAITFDPVLVATGTISASNATYVTGVSPTITVDNGAVHHARFETENNGTESPGFCFTFKVYLHDQDHNLITEADFPASMSNIDLTIKNATSGVNVRRRPFFDVPGDDDTPWDNGNQWSRWSGSIIYDEITGEVVFPLNSGLCLYDGTAVVPTIELSMPTNGSFPGITSSGDAGHMPSDQVTIATGDDHHIHYSHDAGDTGSFACGYDYRHSPSTLHYMCDTANVDDGSTTVYAHIHDAGCNDKGLVSGNWTTTSSVMNASITPTQPSDTSSISFNNQLTVADTVLTFTPTGGTAISEGQARFRVLPGNPESINITLNNGSLVRADQNYNYRIDLLDQYSNIVTTHASSTYTVEIDFEGTQTNSPLGNPPQGEGSSGVGFVAGVYTSENILRTPNLNDSGTARVKATITGISLTTNETSKLVNMIAGTPKRAEIRDASTAAASVISGTTITVPADSPYTFNGVGTDDEGNFAGALNGSWTGDGVIVLDSDLSATTSANATVWDPSPGLSVASPGTLTFAPDNGFPSVSVNPQVVHGSLYTFDVVACVGSSPCIVPTVLTAGQSFNVTVTAQDQDSYSVLDFDSGATPLQFAINDVDSNAEGNSRILSNSAEVVSFSGGVYTIDDAGTIYSTYSTGTKNFSVIWSSGVSYSGYEYFTTAPGPAHHYVTSSAAIADGTPSPSVSNKQAYADLSQTFNVHTYLRDQWGNRVASGPDSSIGLELLKTGGGSADSALNSAIIGLDLSSGYDSASNVAYDVGGNHFFSITGGTLPTDESYSTRFSFVTSKDTVDRYTISLTGGVVTAGNPMALTLTALDKANNPIQDAQASLNSLTFTFAGPGSAPDGTAPAFTTINWGSSGVASVLATLYKAETLLAASYTITDSNSNGVKSGQADQDLLVNAGPIYEYTIDVSGGVLTRTADEDGGFNLDIATFDQWRNPRNGDGYVTLVPVFDSGYSYTGAFSGNVTGINMAATGLHTTGSITYNIGHSITFNLSGGSHTVVTSDTMSFTETIKTVDSYLLGTNSATAGIDNLTLTVAAQDAGANTMTTIDSDLNSQTYSWAAALDHQAF